MSAEPVFEHVCKGTAPILDVIFVHGLTGDPQQTWSVDESGEFWPEWLCTDVDELSIYTLGYPADLFEKWAKKEMDMFERAGNVLERFAGNGLGERPIVFIAHSLGGILTKMILRKSCEAEDDDWRRISDVTRLVVFLSTPHTGAALASVLNVVPNTSKHIKLIANEFGVLEDLNDHYRSLANGRDDLSTAVYYEKHATHKAVVVVSRDSADPGVAKATPVPVDKDHINICKPVDRNDIVYLGIKRHLQKVLKSINLASLEPDDDSEIESYEDKSEGDRRDLLQKLIDAGREYEYAYANDAQNRFARRYIKTGLFTAAREDHDNLLSEIETRFVTHVYHPLICSGADDDAIPQALQYNVIDPLASKQIGSVRINAKLVLSGLYYLTEQCHIKWDAA